ncbi:DMT family transporter [Oceaniglobus ichthyenteri]|uniref:DMT family transporter n=1 Tax=Oceaniglobus ichthyenteri TaxID=2136177 RepID=UPI000D381457|nr:DMT family transporter [Oceaniglobus ichthyenteri]
MTSDRPVLGILLMVGFCFTAPVMDAFAKLASDTIGVGQIVAFRFGIQALLLLPAVMFLAQLAWPERRDWGLHILRAALIIVATGAFFSALRVMPIADAIAIFFVEPFILTLLGALFLGESIGWRRIGACAVGFVGALVIIRPSLAVFGLVAALPLVTAFCFAFYMVLTRRIARRIPPVALQFWTAVAATLLILPILWLTHDRGFQPLALTMPQGVAWIWIMSVGVIASISHMMISFALKFAPAATIAPLQYLEIVAATTLGYYIFDDLPDAQTFLGIALIVASGLYVFLRERRLERAAMLAPQPPV